MLRRRFAAGDRSFSVLGESWFDPASGEWRGRVLFVPLDRSLPRSVASGALVRGARRDDVARRLEAVSDRDLLGALRGVLAPRSRGARGR